MLIDANKYAYLNRQNKKLCYFLSVNDTTIFFRRLREDALSIKTIIVVFDFRNHSLPKHQG